MEVGTVNSITLTLIEEYRDLFQAMNEANRVALGRGTGRESPAGRADILSVEAGAPGLSHSLSLSLLASLTLMDDAYFFRGGSVCDGVFGGWVVLWMQRQVRGGEPARERVRLCPRQRAVCGPRHHPFPLEK